MSTRRGRAAALALACVALVGAVAWILDGAGRAPVDPTRPDQAAADRPDRPELAAHPGFPPESRAHPGPTTGQDEPASPVSPGMRIVEVPVFDEEVRPWGRGVRVTAIVAGEHGESGETSIESETDDTGHARFTVPVGRAVRFVVRRGGGEAARFDVRAGSGASDATPALVLSRRMPLAVWVRRQGVPTLPRAFAVAVDGKALDIREQRPSEGTLVGIFEVSDQPRPHVLTFTEAGGPTIAVPLPPEQATYRGMDATIDLDPAGPVLRIEIQPAGLEIAAPAILQRWDEATGAWAWDRFLRLDPTPGADGDIRESIPGLTAGRYRILEGETGRTSAEIAIVRGGPTAVLTMDLNGAGVARGRVVPVEGRTVFNTQIWLLDPATTTGGPRTKSPVHPDGTFSVVVPGDRPVRIVARHPEAILDDPASQVTLREPRDDIVLRLVAAPGASLRLLGSDGNPLRGVVFVSLRRREAGAQAVQSATTANDGQIWFGGFAAGRYDVLLHHEPDAPLVLSGVSLTAEPTHLGTHTLLVGRSIRLRALRPADMPWPKGLSAFVELLEPSWPTPFGEGIVDASGEGRVVGLLPGRYRVRFHGNEFPLPAAVGVEHTVEVTDTNDPVVTIDFRPEARETK
jgi:hypothetical protein